MEKLISSYISPQYKNILGDDKAEEDKADLRKKKSLNDDIPYTTFDSIKSGTGAEVSRRVFKKTDKGLTTSLCKKPIPKKGTHIFRTQYTKEDGGLASIGIAAGNVDLNGWIGCKNAWSYGGNGFACLNGLESPD